MRMCGDLISDLTKHFSKLVTVERFAAARGNEFLSPG